MPLSRQKQNGDMWIKRSNFSAKSNEKKADLQKIVEQQDLIIKYYQQKYPKENPDPDLEFLKAIPSLDLTDIGQFMKAESIWKAYQSQISSLQKLLQKEEMSKRDRQEVDMSLSKVEVLRKENQILLEQNKRNEEIVLKYFSLVEKQAKMENEFARIQKEICSLSELNQILVKENNMKLKENRDLNENIEKLRMTCQALQHNENTMKAKLQSVCHERDSYMDKFSLLSNRSSVLEIWINSVVKPIIEDYKESLTYLNVPFPYDEDSFPLTPDDKSELGIFKPLSEIAKSFATEQLQSLRDKLNETKKKLNTLEVKYKNDIHVEEIMNQEGKLHIETLMSMAEKCKIERDDALKKCLSHEKDLIKARQEYRLLKIDNQTILDQIVHDTKLRLSELENRAQTDRENYDTMISQLSKSKIDLQAEVGILLREKRQVQEELIQVYNDWDKARGSFLHSLDVARNEFTKT
ncbi:hypothetical protein ROZALSC1DRAFT_26767 [Rozella allomycis CSF55]|uniref:Uncharacterized protein n=1 Tax=Rozella allomycis (strain CSF55) TaxID=988480 RepID=A0A4P9YQ71_ROZAC|nr:hypothetical protein ROZALSC1DRAFT_26767 [Rozella allomycis CSF55]